MSPETFVVFIIVAMVGMAWHNYTRKRDKIKCTFRRVNKTKITKFIKMSSRYIIFENGKYDIITSRITFEWDRSGMVGWLFPQFVPTLDYSYHSRFPHDPNDMKISSETPATRKALNKEEWVESYYRGAKPSTAASKKQGFFVQYLPWIAIGVTAIVAFYLYQNIQAINYDLDVIKNILKSVTK